MDTGILSRPDQSALHALLRNAAFLNRSRTRAQLPDLQAGGPPIEDIEEIVEAGFLLAPLPPEFGGCGWGNGPEGAPGLLEALRLLGRVSLPLGRLYEGHINAVSLALRHGAVAQREQVRSALREGRLFGVWNTEAPDNPLRTEGRMLRGGKILCSGIGVVERALVTARSPSGESRMWLVPLDRLSTRGDLAGWNPLGMRSSATGRIDLDGIAQEDCLPLGAPDAYLEQPHFSGGAWRFLAVQLGGIEAIAEAHRQHLRLTGRGEDPHQAARLGRALTAAEAARLWVREACLAVETAELGTDRLVAYVDLARGAVERAALEVMELAQRSIGLQAFMATHPVERLVRDLATYLRQPAPDRALVAGAAAGLGLEAPVGDMWS